jgi:uncharacterized protein YndB with AHSA1/START domain
MSLFVRGWWPAKYIGSIRGLPGIARLIGRERRIVKSYSFKDTWQVEAAPARVWKLISQPKTYPQWWPIYLDASLIKDTGGVGTTASLKFRALLPYTLSITTLTTRSEPPRLAEGTVSGELDGTWRWTLEPNGSGTEVTFEETVFVRKMFLNLIAPLAHKLFEMNHRVAARRGAEGMRAYLGREGEGSRKAG